MTAMRSFSRWAGRGVFATLASGLVLCAAPVSAQEVVQQLPSSGPGERLDQSLRILRKSPNDVYSLINAGEASLELNDPSMALTYFQRADQISPNEKRVKIGLARALVKQERPNDALSYFSEAERLGARDYEVAGDRGLAYDLIGNPTAAQADYRIAMKTDPSDKIVRRMALSLGISGKANDAIRMLQPIIQHGDKGALRDEAFVRAMNNDQNGAQQIARMAMPSANAAQFDPFFRRLPALNAAERARAVHFGDMPVEGTRYASVEQGAIAGRTPRGSGPDAGLIPEGAPLGSSKGKAKPKVSTAQARREAEKAERARVAKAAEDKRMADAQAAAARKREREESKGKGKAAPVRVVRADPVPPPPKVESMRSRDVWAGEAVRPAVSTGTTPAAVASASPPPASIPVKLVPDISVATPTMAADAAGTGPSIAGVASTDAPSTQMAMVSSPAGVDSSATTQMAAVSVPSSSMKDVAQTADGLTQIDPSASLSPEVVPSAPQVLAAVKNVAPIPGTSALASAATDTIKSVDTEAEALKPAVASMPVAATPSAPLVVQAGQSTSRGLMGPVLDGNSPSAPSAATSVGSSSTTPVPAATNLVVNSTPDGVGTAARPGPTMQAGEVVQALPPPPPPAPAKPKEESKAATAPAKTDSKGTGTAVKGKEATSATSAKGKDASTATAGKSKGAADSKTTAAKDAKATSPKDTKDTKGTGTTPAKGKAPAKDDPKAKTDPKGAKGKDTKAAEAKDAKDSSGSKKGAAAQERYWLQVATGADTKALGFDLKRIKSKYSFLAPYGGYTAPFRSSKRLVMGPFKTVAEAKAAEAKANKAGLSSFVWISPAGMDVDPLGGK